MKPQMKLEAEARATDAGRSWRPSTRVAFRFVFSYFLLYIFPGAVGALGAGMPNNDAYRRMWHAIVPWVGENLLHLHGDMTEVANGSGDQLYDYILLLCLLVVAMVATAIWSWIDRKRTNYDQLYEWLRLFVRLTLAVAMISYGANKLFRMQFPEPPLYRFVDYYGNSSPMGLLWTFMGMSRAYSLFRRNRRNAGRTASDCASLHHARSAGDLCGHEQCVDAQLLLRRAQKDLLDASGADELVPASSRRAHG